MVSCAVDDPRPLPDGRPQSDKIHFDLAGFTEEGLWGPTDGLRARSYEFCIPARADVANQVQAIDPSVIVFQTSPGRIGCTGDQYLCIGNTHQPGFRSVLADLAQLDYVTGIDPSYAE